MLVARCVMLHDACTSPNGHETRKMSAMDVDPPPPPPDDADPVTTQHAHSHTHVGCFMGDRGPCVDVSSRIVDHGAADISLVSA